ncbi:hypothetical protein RUM44_012438 [Polyplax serrata]|uniref:Gustatory receptor n=1 Tax=Polyplax serrata TaxID=468196 RepID=A0ABR1BBA2_POLSC
MTGHPSLNFILKLLQLCGLGPFLTINYHHKIVQVTLLIFYNLCLVAFLTYNTVTGFLKNGRIASGCTRRSTLIKISFDVADLLENLHFSFIGLRCLVFLGKGNSLWLNLVKVDDKFRKLEAEFNEKAMTLCLCAATVVHLSIYFIFLKANDTVIGFHDLHDNTYSMFYAPPLLLNTLLNVAFNAFTLILHQRFWVINQFLKSFLVYYRNEKLTMTLRQLDWRNADYSIEKSISKHRSRRISPLWRSMRNKTGPLGLVKNGKQPFWVMLKDDYCFTQSFYRRHNNSVDFVRQLKILHFRLYEVTDSLNSVFGYNLLFIFGISFFGCIINFYFVIVYHLRSDQADQYVTCVYWMFYYIIRVIIIILCTNSASAEVIINFY